MSTAGAALRNSNVWDSRFDIPAVPAHLNPHIYTAYTVRILESVEPKEVVTDEASYVVHDMIQEAQIIRATYTPFLQNCTLSMGVISTYPNGGTAVPASSHDDAYGAGFLNHLFASQCALRLSQRDGAYGVAEIDETKNFYRFGFVRPAMHAWASEVDLDFKLGAISNASYIGALLFHLWFTKEGDTSGHLLKWLSFPIMRKKSKLCAAVIDHWAETWTKRGYTPKSIFKNNYLTECPWFAENARDDWK